MLNVKISSITREETIYITQEKNCQKMIPLSCLVFNLNKDGKYRMYRNASIVEHVFVQQSKKR